MTLRSVPNLGGAPRWPFAIDRQSPQSRGIVMCAPFLNGLPPVDIASSRVYGWTNTAPSYIVPACVQGKTQSLQAIDGNASAYVATGYDYSLAGVSTLTIEWWMSEDDNYLAADGARYVASTRTAGNAGWSVGKISAAAGPPGNATTPYFVIQGVAGYNPATYDIPARKWTHVCITLNGTSLTMYVDGVSIHTATTGSMTTGGSMYLLGQGTAGASPWTNNIHSLIVRNAVLTPAEVFARANPSTTFGVYYELGRKTWFIPAASTGLAANPLYGGGAAANPLWGYVS